MERLILGECEPFRIKRLIARIESLPVSESSVEEFSYLHSAIVRKQSKSLKAKYNAELNKTKLKLMDYILQF